ncbi:class Ib ribonucleoside-diphosphate reductase assembly flavoprotein NrdI [Ligilactobacillus apodemi]|uniref:Ribonucleotide reductase stimulatory protein n=1 Tax=Ligilactobacillus apodemi DSM 16634 = JCM 16172 TaxID=1423724 RepID=A0A0R1U1R7_9LACO|nr:class Ib ribonucleoside-diphosphate reductase assembly flavoprotein NrdI [Ligilactobacillus apodemi]KRL85144.1 ribonucleotide reductase stimulatory protein [Ligilactobacillus apodemi DSM 16634 = JCM 16172]
MKIVYFSVTGQTRRFIKKLGAEFSAYEIDPVDPFFELNEPFVLIIPTYEDEITYPVIEFLKFKNNAAFFKGIVGTGNRNFAELFIFTAKNISKKFNVPLIYSFEFNGTPKDVQNFKEAVNKLES